MRNYKEEYQRWLDSPALSEEEWNELNSIAGDEKEIENRFFAPPRPACTHLFTPNPLPTQYIFALL